MLTKLMAVTGVLLIVAGVMALAYRQISYTTRETVLDIGPVEATTESRNVIPLPPNRIVQLNKDRLVLRGESDRENARYRRIVE